jgi:hypothetical protein
MTRVDRNAVQASFWQFDPDTEEEPEVEAMPSSLSIVRDEDRVLIAVRGKQGRRHETGDSVWLEMSDTEAVRLIARLATAVSS